MVATLIPVNLPNFLISSDICMASSRVGASTSPCMPPPCFVFCSMDMPNAAVLPEPVWAWPTTSLPESSTGMVASCMGKVSSKPIFTRAFSMGASTPSDSKVAVPFFTCPATAKSHRFPPLSPAGKAQTATNKPWSRRALNGAVFWPIRPRRRRENANCRTKPRGGGMHSPPADARDGLTLPVARPAARQARSGNSRRRSRQLPRLRPGRPRQPGGGRIEDRPAARRRRPGLNVSHCGSRSISTTALRGKYGSCRTS